MSSLLALTLSKLPLEELKDICYGPPSPLKNQLLEKCDWEVWRNRAETLFNIPPDYFDLPLTYTFNGIPRRDITGLERYIEIATYIKLGEYSPVTIYENGFIEGVYESVAGVEQSLAREDPEGVGIFYPRLTEHGYYFLREEYLGEKKSPHNPAVLELLDLITGKVHHGDRYVLINTIRSGPIIGDIKDYSREELLALIRYGNEEAFQYLLSINKESELKDEEFFFVTIQSGITKWVQVLLPMFLETNISIIKSVPIVPFRVVDPNEENPFPLINLQERVFVDVEMASKILHSAVFSCNVQLFDFFRSLLREENRMMEFSLLEGYNFHHKPVEAYSILQRIKIANAPAYFADIENDNTDLITLHLSRTNINKDYLNYTILINKGNIPLLLTLLPILVKTVPRAKKYIHSYLINLQSSPYNIYPLTKLILEDYLI